MSTACLCVRPSSAPELIDLSSESQATLDLYGIEKDTPSFARNCLLARRLIERGTRFVQLYHTNWDSHGGPGENLQGDFEKVCRDVDQGQAALVKDLKSRGLLDDTLVIWGGEFGRTPMMQGGNDGRDHHPNAFTMWLAGGGIKPGITHGASDELGFNATEGRVHVHDLHAKLGSHAARAKLVKVDVPEARARWVEPGEEYNKIGYWRVFGTKLRWTDDGKDGTLDVVSMIIRFGDPIGTEYRLVEQPHPGERT